MKERVESELGLEADAEKAVENLQRLHAHGELNVAHSTVLGLE